MKLPHYAVLFATLITPLSASAANWGVVIGKLSYYNELSNYCPSTRACTGARYTESQFQTYQPMANTTVYITDPNSQAQWGVGQTDDSGNFEISWWNNYPQGQPSYATLQWKGAHANNRFYIRDGAGASLDWRAGFIHQHGTTIWDPQDLGEIGIGSNGSEDPLAHVYAGAERTWRDSFQYSNRLAQNYGSTQVRAFNTICSTSCAVSATLIHLDTDPRTPFAFSGRIAHELGHTASHRLSREGNSNACGNYSYGSASNGWWSLWTPEWTCAGYEEAFATWIGDVARYWYDSDPDICGAFIGPCPTMAEPSLGAPGGGGCSDCSGCSGGNCPPANQTDCDGRHVGNMVKFLWDLYDTNEDSETLSEPYNRICDNNFNWMVGTGNGLRDEPFGSPNDWDGKAARDYSTLYVINYGVSPLPAYNNNCAAPGD
ncbi:MAG: hypothetical protein MJD61_20300 [Proteobacteria bacterium]|nr:hypothetical protein [Pseudomonadota bacterium]